MLLGNKFNHLTLLLRLSRSVREQNFLPQDAHARWSGTEAAPEEHQTYKGGDMRIPDGYFRYVSDHAPFDQVLTKLGLSFKRFDTSQSLLLRCPFHPFRERTPSFRVHEVLGDIQIGHCLGCGESFTLFAFLEKYLGGETPQERKKAAIRWLWRHFKISSPYRRRQFYADY